MKNLLALSCLSLTLSQFAYAAGIETVKCSLKLSRASEKIADAKMKSVSIKIEDNEGDLNIVLDKATTENVDISIETKETVQGLYGVALRHWPTDKSDNGQVSFGNVLLMSEGTIAENADVLSESIHPRAGKKDDTILSLHPYAMMGNSLSALTITKAALTALREVGYKGSAIVNNYTSFEAIDGFVAQAVAQNKIQKTELVLFGFEGNCQLAK